MQNKEKRVKKFNKDLFMFVNHPNFKDVRELYVNDIIKNIASAEKTLRDIRITNKGEVFKNSVAKQTQLKKQINKMNNLTDEKILKFKRHLLDLIEWGLYNGIDQYKGTKEEKISIEALKLINKDRSDYYVNLERKLNELNNDNINKVDVSLGSLKYYLISKNEFATKLINLIKKIKIQRTLLLIDDGKGYTLNDINSKRLLELISGEIIANAGFTDSDHEIKNALLADKNKLTIKKVKNVAIYEKASGEFFRYLNKTEIDLSDYQIYNQQQFNEVNHNESCLNYALKKAGLSDDKLSSIKIMIKNRNIPLSDIQKICDKLKICIHIKKICSDRNKVFIYGKEHNEKYELGLIEEHYFNIKKTDYTSYAINNYWNIKDIENFNYIYNDKLHRKKDRCIDSFELINIFINKKNEYLEEMSFDNCNIANTQFYDKINNEVDCLEYDENIYCQLAVKEEKENKKQKYTQIIYFDFETYKNNNNEHIAYLLCAEFNNENGKKIKSYIGSDCAKEFLKDINEHSLLIAHNVSYDYRFIVDHLYNINEISRGSKLIGCSATIYNNNKSYNVYIKDSYHLIGQPLRNFSKIFNLDVKKEVMPYDLYSENNINNIFVNIDECLKFVKENEKDDFIKNVKDWKLLNNNNEVDIITYSKNYCLLDVDVLSKGYNIFKTWMNEHFKIDCNECLTIASLAHKYLINTGCYDDVYELGGVPQNFIQGCVVGGRTMTNNNEMQTFNLKNNVNKRMQDFDAVSLYPSAMRRMKGFLKGKPKVLKDLTYDFLKQQDGYFIEIKIKSVGIKRNFSLMSYKNEDGIRIFSNDMIDKKIKVDKCTLEDLIEFQKIEFEIIRGYYFNDGYNNKINDVIHYIFSKRLELKKIKNPAELTYKLIMNNAYGKSIMKPIENEIKIFTNEQKFETFIDRNYNWINSFNTYGKDNNKYKVKVVKKLSDHFNICQVGVEILSMSKRIMNEVMNLAEDNNLKIYYQDTDSMHIEEQDIDILQRKFNEKYQRELIGKNMGQFHSDFDLKGAEDVYASRSIFLGKKSYIDELKGVDKDGNIKTGYHIRMKGIPTSCIEYTSKKMGLNNPFELYEKMLNGEAVTFDLTQDGNKANFEFTKDYKIITKTDFLRTIKF